MFNTDLPDLPLPVLVGVGILALISLTLCITAIIAVAKTPTKELPGGLHRTIWILLCFVQFVGPIAFFVLRRRERRMMVDEIEETDASVDHGIIGRLYG